MSKGWEPARLMFGSEMRTHRAGAVLLVVVLAVASGVAMTAFAAARRSSTAYERFLAWADAPEIAVGGCDCPPEQLTRELELLRTAPFVLDSVMFGYAALSVGFADGTHASSLALLPVVDLEGRLGRELPRAKMWTAAGPIGAVRGEHTRPTTR